MSNLKEFHALYNPVFVKTSQSFSDGFFFASILTRYCLTGDLNFLLSRHKDENITFRWLKVDLNRLLYSTLYVVFRRITSKENIDWKCSTGDRECWNVAKEFSKLISIHGSRGDNELEVVATRHNLEKERGEGERGRERENP